MHEIAVGNPLPKTFTFVPYSATNASPKHKHKPYQVILVRLGHVLSLKCRSVCLAGTCVVWTSRRKAAQKVSTRQLDVFKRRACKSCGRHPVPLVVGHPSWVSWAEVPWKVPQRKQPACMASLKTPMGTPSSLVVQTARTR